MYSQIKYGYKKSREEFMEQLRSIRKQLEEKICKIDDHYQYVDRAMMRGEHYSSFQKRLPLRAGIGGRGTERGEILKGGLEMAGENPEVEAFLPEMKYYNKIKDSESNRKLKSRAKINMLSSVAIRHSSLPSKSRNSGSTTAQPQSPIPSFEPIFLKMPKAREKRTSTHLNSALSYLLEHNPFFQKLDSYMSLCLLKIGYYIELQPGQVLYGIKFDRSSFFIILNGTVTLLNPTIGIKKPLAAGQALGQEMLFGTSPIRYHLELARSTTKSYLLEIKTNDYTAMGEQLKKLGYLREFQRLEAGLRDGHREKNVMRSQHVVQRKLRMKSLS